jgi:hypothetical protein
MAKIKTYGIRGISECVMRLEIGKASITCNFTNGDLQSRQPIPAQYTTVNPIAQHAIESCETYKSGKIFVVSEYETAPEPETAPVEEEKPKKKKVAKTARVMENVRTYGDAMTALMTESEVNVGELKNINDCLAKAAELGISFPNLKA